MEKGVGAVLPKETGDFPDIQGLKQSTEFFHQERLRELAKDPKNIVYTIETDEVERNMTSSECKAVINDMWKYMSLRKAARPDLKTKKIRFELENMTQAIFSSMVQSSFAMDFPVPYFQGVTVVGGPKDPRNFGKKPSSSSSFKTEEKKEEEKDEKEEKIWMPFIGTHVAIFVYMTDPRMNQEFFEKTILKMIYVKFCEEKGAYANAELAKKQVSIDLVKIFTRPDIPATDEKKINEYCNMREAEEKELNRKIEAEEI